MSPRDDSLRLDDMLTAAGEARQFASGKTLTGLLKDRQLTLALLKSTLICRFFGQPSATTYPS